MPTLPYILPYACWMALMLVLPATAQTYALRSAAVFGILIWAIWPIRHKIIPTKKEWIVAISAGVLVFLVWIAPEEFEIYQKWFVFGDSPNISVYDPKECGWPLTLIKLCGSAFVIAVAEEMFFRKFLLDFAGFWWTVALFAVEHDRFAVAAIAGVVYGIVRMKVSLRSAVVAHVVTNFILGVYVIRFAKWQLW